MKLKDVFKKIFSIDDYSDERYMLTILGIKLRLQKNEFKKLRKQNPFYYYKKNNIDITTIPPAEGQIREVQLANLALLREMDYVCKENGLKYWIDAGTLIGALRHKGFIPWDDDIDTAMMREDYDKIIEAFDKSSRNPDIYADYFRDELSQGQYFIKVQHRKCPHVFVDIFPFDVYGPSMSVKEQLQRTKKVKNIIKYIKHSTNNLTTNEELKAKIDTLMSEKVLVNQIPEDIETSDLIWGINFHHRWNNWFTNYNVIFPLRTIMFEGYEFSCMNNPDVFLTRVYGNYMAYPKKITLGHNAYKKFSEEDKVILKELIDSLNK